MSRTLSVASQRGAAGEAARSPHIVFPRYESNAPARFHAIPKARAFIKLSGNSFTWRFLALTAWYRGRSH